MMPWPRIAIALVRAMIIATAVTVAVSLTDELGSSGGLVAGATVVVVGEMALGARSR